MVPCSVSTSSWHWAHGLAPRACLPILEGDRRRASDRDVAGRMTDEYDALIAEIKGERVARAVG